MYLTICHLIRPPFYNARNNTKRPEIPPTEAKSGATLTAAAFGVDVVYLEPVAVEPEDFVHVPDSQQVSLCSLPLYHYSPVATSPAVPVIVPVTLAPLVAAAAVSLPPMAPAV